VWSPMLGTFLLPPSPAHGRQIPAKKKGCLSARSNQCPHHGALRCVLVGLGEGCRRNDATMLAVQPVAPQVVLQAPKVGPVTGAWLGTVGSPKELPLHRLSVSSLVQFVDEVPPGHRRIEGRDIHAVDDSFIGLADPPSPRYFPNLSHAKSAEGDSMQPEPRFSRCYAPIDLTADVPAGQRPVRKLSQPLRPSHPTTAWVRQPGAGRYAHGQ
jgi:hypothetical protein